MYMGPKGFLHTYFGDLWDQCMYRMDTWGPSSGLATHPTELVSAFRRRPHPNHEPRGSKYPIFKDPGPKSHEWFVFGTTVLKYWVLGPSG